MDAATTSPMFFGTAQSRVLEIVRKRGSYRTLTQSEQRAAIKLNEKGLVRRDKVDGHLWYDAERPQGGGGDGGPKYSVVGIEPTEGADRLPAPQRALQYLPVDLIDIGFRLRQNPDAAKVEALKESFLILGQRQPISVTPRPDSPRFLLSAGLHRVAATRAIEWTHIWAFIDQSDDDLDAELWEIDENLCRAELTPSDRALFTFRRKEIFLMRNPETAHGGDRTASRQIGDLKDENGRRFSSATALATGQSERTIQRDAERGEKISEQALRMLRGTAADKGVVLDRLKGLPEHMQIVVAEAELAEIRRKQVEAKALRDHQRAQSRQNRGEIIRAIAERGTVSTGAMPRAAFPIIYADPPWEQEAWSEERGQDRGLRYPHMPLDEIKALCAGDKTPATRDALLALWTTANRLDDAIDVLRCWGFDYVTHLVWDKVHIGMGRWVRDRHETLLIGKRGNFPAPLPGTQSASVFAEVKGEHSAKPVYFAEMIERLYPDLPKLELFQRRESLAEGDIRLNGTWTFWGNQAGTPEGEAE